MEFFLYNCKERDENRKREDDLLSVATTSRFRILLKFHLDRFTMNAKHVYTWADSQPSISFSPLNESAPSHYYVTCHLGSTKALTTLFPVVTKHTQPWNACRAPQCLLTHPGFLLRYLNLLSPSPVVTLRRNLC
jgi:hypothetical protein